MNLNLEEKLAALHEVSKFKLKSIFDPLSPIDLVIDTSLLKSFEKICTVTWLRSNGVQKIYKFDSKLAISFENTPVYFIRFEIKQFKGVLEQIKLIKTTKQVHVIVFPKIISHFDLHLEAQGLHDRVLLHNFQWLPIYYDFGTICLDYEKLFRNLFVLDDYTYLPALSSSLWELSLIFGDPGYVIAVGSSSCATINQFEILNEIKKTAVKPKTEFSDWILMDRSVDYVTALLTPFTYSGLLMELFDVKQNILKTKKTTKKFDDKLNPQKKSIVSKNDIILDATKDNIFKSIKNKYFTNVSDLLSDKVKELKSQKAQRPHPKDLSALKQSITLIKDVSTKEKHISNHLQLCEFVLNELRSSFDNIFVTEEAMLTNKNRTSNLKFIEEILVTENNLFKALSTFCLMTLVQNLTFSEYHDFKRKFLHEFGYKLVYIFEYLEHAKLLIKPKHGTNKLTLLSSSLKDFHNFSKKFQLMNSGDKNIDVQDPKCSSYVFNGSYIPLISQLISKIFHKTDDEFLSRFHSFQIPTKKIQLTRDVQSRNLLVCIIGGVTAAEIAVFELLENLYQIRIVNLATNFVSSKSLINELVQL